MQPVKSSDWDRYRKVQETEMRRYISGETLYGVAVTPGVVPEIGGMIARDPNNHKDQWYVTPEFFSANYERGEYTQKHTGLLPYQQRVVEEKAALDEKLALLMKFFDTKTYKDLPDRDAVLLRDQHEAMERYGTMLELRIARFKSEQFVAFESAMIDLQEATDGQGHPVLLYQGPFTYEDLRHATFDFMEPFSPTTVFINGLDPAAPQKPAEVAAWRNLALLARATAAALEAGL